jgi:hypothetical protein
VPTESEFLAAQKLMEDFTGQKWPLPPRPLGGTDDANVEADRAMKILSSAVAGMVKKAVADEREACAQIAQRAGSAVAAMGIRSRSKRE